MRNTLIVLGCLLASSLPATAGVIRHDVTPPAYLDLAAQSQFASVGRLNSAYLGGSLIASGTLIAPDVVLTAAHTVANASSLTFYVGGNTYTGSQWTAFPSWSGNLEAGYDIGLIKLSAPVLNVAPAIRYRGNKEVGSTVTQVGYGMTGTGLTGATRYDGSKRAGTNRVDSTSAGSGSSARLLWMDFDRPSASSNGRNSSSGPTALEYLIARGDSGGGLFANIGGLNQLIGVSSLGYTLDGLADASYGEKAAFTRVSAFNAWIDSMLRQFSPSNSKNIGQWLTRPGLRANELLVGVPEPTTATVAWMAIAMLPLLRRWRARRPLT